MGMIKAISTSGTMSNSPPTSMALRMSPASVNTYLKTSRITTSVS
jgi:hypothetical protein